MEYRGDGMDDIRIGVIGTDNGHGAIYSSFFNGWDHDVPLLTRLGDGSVALGHYSWGLRLREYELRDPPLVPIDGARVTRIWSQNLHDAALVARGCEIASVCEDVGEVYDDVDAVMVLHGDPTQNLRHARTALRRGLPTFIDKPLATDMATVEQIIQAAEESRTPWFTGSALRYSPELLVGRKAIEPAIGRAVSASVQCPLNFEQYGIHALEILSVLFGAQSRLVDARAYPDRDVVLIEQANGPSTLIENVRHLRAPVYQVRLFSAEGDFAVPLGKPVSSLPYLAARFVEMVRTRRPPVEAVAALQVLPTYVAALDALALSADPRARSA